ncbi:putative ribonuclease H-like domain-containing protein [Tanacetum coccineum]
MHALEDISIFNLSRDNEDVGAEADMNNLDTTIQVSHIPTTRIHKDHPPNHLIGDLQSATKTRNMSKNLEEHGKNPKRNKKDKRGIVIRNKARLVTQGYTQEEGIDYDEVFSLVARIEAIMLFLAYALFKDFVVYQMDVKSAFLYGKIEEEVHVCQPPRFEDPGFPNRVYKVEKVLYGLHQTPRAWHKGDILLVYVYVDDIIFGSTKKEMCNAFEKLMHEKFQMSSMGKLIFFLRLQVEQKKDGIFISQDKYVGEILKKFRSMIGSLMYLTSPRPDIMFAVCACARYQVNPKVSHLYVVKRIFRYLKGQPKLGLWYPKDSPFDLVAYTDSDYAGASLDRKSTTRGCQFLGCRLISWQCKKQTVVANSTTEANMWLLQVVVEKCFGFRINYLIIDKAVNEEMDDSLVRAATTASSLKAEQDSGNIIKTRSKATPNEPSYPGTSSGGGPRRQETMGDTIPQTRFENVSKLSNDPLLARVLALETTKTTQANEIAGLKRKVKKLESINKSRTHGLKILYKVGSSRRVESSDDKGLGEEDASKQGRIADIDANKDIYLVNVHTDEDMFGVNDLDGDEVIIDNVDVVKTAEKTRSMVKEVTVIEKAKLVSAAEETVNVVATTVSTASTILVSAATTTTTTTTTVSDVEITLAQALAELKSAKPKADKVLIQEPEQGTTTTTLTITNAATIIIADSTRPKVKRIVIHEQEQEPTPIVSSQQPSQVKVQDKGKGEIVKKEPAKKMSKKDLLMLDEELAFKL